jgi:transcription elongation factor SPT4
MEGYTDRVAKYTTPYFEGLIGLVDPNGSWVAKWQRIDNCKPGMYAIEMIGNLPKEMRDFCDENGIPYKINNDGRKNSGTQS